MADTIKKYLDQAAAQALVNEVKARDAATLQAAKDYCDSKDSQFEVAGAAATAETNAKAHAEAKVNELADGQVKLNKEAIEKLNGADTVEGSVAKAVKDAKDALQTNIDGVDAKADKNAEDILAINNAETGILKQAKDYTDTEVKVVQDEIDALEELVGTLPEGTSAKDVVDYVNIKTAGIATDAALGELQNQLSGVQGEVATIKGDYLKAADKTELEGKIGTAQDAADAAQDAVDRLAETHATDKKALEDAIALKADQTALESVSEVANAAVKQADYDVKIKALEDEDVRIAGLVSAEAERAAGVEADHEERLTEVEAFFKLAEGEQLDTALDTLVEIQGYITSEGAAADKMVEDIAANAKAIEDHLKVDHDFAAADEALKEELEGKIDLKAAQADHEALAGRVTTAEGKITTLEGKVETLEGEMDGVQAAVATKAEAQALTDAVTALEGVDAGQETRIAALEAKFGEGEGSVEDQIEDAKQAAIDAAAEDATEKANAAEEAAKGHADSLNTAMDDRVKALEEIDHDHSNKAELDLIASGDKAKWDAAAGKAHEHANKDVLDGISAEKVAAWDASEKNAKDYADGLNSAMTTKVDAIDARVTAVETKAGANETAITNLTTKHNEDKTTLQAAIDANAAAIASFSPITPDDITAMFAATV